MTMFLRPSIYLKMYISIVTPTILIKFHAKHHKEHVKGKAVYDFGTNCLDGNI